MEFDLSALTWTRAPKAFDLQPGRISITTQPQVRMPASMSVVAQSDQP